ncbi:MAG: hypothetical protein ACKO34_08220 [Vampirovibrionales bacterium]
MRHTLPAGIQQAQKVWQGLHPWQQLAWVSGVSLLTFMVALAQPWVQQGLLVLCVRVVASPFVAPLVEQHLSTAGVRMTPSLRQSLKESRWQRTPERWHQLSVGTVSPICLQDSVASRPRWQACVQQLKVAASFGFNLTAPLQLVSLHKASIQHVEAHLQGQAGITAFKQALNTLIPPKKEVTPAPPPYQRLEVSIPFLSVTLHRHNATSVTSGTASDINGQLTLKQLHASLKPHYIGVRLPSIQLHELQLPNQPHPLGFTAYATLQHFPKQPATPTTVHIQATPTHAQAPPVGFGQETIYLGGRHESLAPSLQQFSLTSHGILHQLHHPTWQPWLRRLGKESLSSVLQQLNELRWDGVLARILLESSSASANASPKFTLQHLEGSSQLHDVTLAFGLPKHATLLQQDLPLHLPIIDMRITPQGNVVLNVPQVLPSKQPKLWQQLSLTHQASLQPWQAWLNGQLQQAKPTWKLPTSPALGEGSLHLQGVHVATAQALLNPSLWRGLHPNASGEVSSDVHWSALRTGQPLALKGSITGRKLLVQEGSLTLGQLPQVQVSIATPNVLPKPSTAFPWQVELQVPQPARFLNSLASVTGSLSGSIPLHQPSASFGPTVLDGFQQQWQVTVSATTSKLTTLEAWLQQHRSTLPFSTTQLASTELRPSLRLLHQGQATLELRSRGRSFNLVAHRLTLPALGWQSQGQSHFSLSNQGHLGSWQLEHQLKSQVPLQQAWLKTVNPWLHHRLSPPLPTPMPAQALPNIVRWQGQLEPSWIAFQGQGATLQQVAGSLNTSPLRLQLTEGASVSRPRRLWHGYASPLRIHSPKQSEALQLSPWHLSLRTAGRPSLELNVQDTLQHWRYWQQPEQHRGWLKATRVPVSPLLHALPLLEAYLPKEQRPLPRFWRSEGELNLQSSWNRTGVRSEFSTLNVGTYLPKTLAPLHGLNTQWVGFWPWQPTRQGKKQTASLTLVNHTNTVNDSPTLFIGNSPLYLKEAHVQQHPTQANLLQWTLLGEGQLSTLELNKLIGNNTFFQPTHYPIQGRVNIRSSGTFHPAHPLRQQANQTVVEATLETNHQQTLGRLSLPLTKVWGKPLTLTNAEVRVLEHPTPWLVSASLDAPNAPQWLWSHRVSIKPAEPFKLQQLGLGEWTTEQDKPTQPWFNSGVLDADLHWSQAFEPPNLHIRLKDATSEFLSIEKLDAQLDTDALVAGKVNQLRLSVPQFTAAGSDVQIQATATLPQALPIAFSPVFVSGNRLYVDGLQQWLHERSQPVQQIVQAGLPPSLSWLPSKQSLLPFEFHNGVLNFEQVVFQNILLNHYVGGLELFSHQFMDLSPMSCDVAGGKLKANIWLSPQQDNRITIEMEAQKVKVNALATTLLNSPNQIFGDLTGKVSVSTWGDSQEEQIKHTNGDAHFVIEEGRIPALSTVERLLTLSNLWRGGALGLNIANLYAVLSPTSQLVYKGNMWGDATFLDGNLLTKSTITDGQNLDLWLNGQLSMLTGKSEMTITGSILQDATTVLPKWSQWNLRRGFGYVPVPYVGGQRLPLEWTHKPSLFDYIPAVGFMPGFGGIPNKKNFFSIDAKGNLENPGSYKNLQWLERSSNPILNQLP